MKTRIKNTFKKLLKRQPKICLCLCIYNEEKNLPLFLEYILPYVDFVVALDDGSTDNSVKILKNCPKVKKIIKHPKKTDVTNIDEGSNRESVVRAAFNAGANWALTLDPDERPEINFLKDLNKICRNAPEKICYNLHTRELWGGIDQYRDDGIWDNKYRGSLFPISKDDKFEVNRQRIHSKWYPDSLLGTEYNLDYNLYHLKMVKAKDRTARKKLYNKLDPKKEFQPIGYDYLTDSKNLHITKIPKSKAYDYDSVPDYYI